MFTVVKGEADVLPYEMFNDVWVYVKKLTQAIH